MGGKDGSGCTSTKSDSFEFFVVTGFPPDDAYYSNSLFSGVLGLATNLSNDAMSMTEYLKATQQID